MARADTVCGTLFRLALAGTALAVLANGQTPEWRRLGNAVVAEGLAGAAGGGVDRVWFNADGTSYTEPWTPGSYDFRSEDYLTTLHWENRASDTRPARVLPATRRVGSSTR